MTRQDARATAVALLHKEFPNARMALLAGSSARGGRTATSDLDIVVLLEGPQAPYRETVRYQGWVAELFVHTAESLQLWWGHDAEAHRNTLADMCAHAVVLVDHGLADQVRILAEEFLAAGPAALSRAELESRRYALTAALEDLADENDPDERDAVAAMILTWVAELALLAERQWLGRGKWLVRRLRELDPSLADRLLAAHRRAVAQGETADLIRVAEDVLSRVGGRLSAGYRSE